MHGPAVPVADPAAAVDLSQYERLVFKLAWRYLRRLPPQSCLALEDLAQEGWLCLVRALRTYDQAKSRFMTYAHLSLARRFSELVQVEWSRASHLPVQYEGGVEEWEDAEESVLARVKVMPSQGLVDCREDLLRGQWSGPVPKTRRQAEELVDRLEALA